jgi:hypothetical protein
MLTTNAAMYLNPQEFAANTNSLTLLNMLTVALLILYGAMKVIPGGRLAITIIGAFLAIFMVVYGFSRLSPVKIEPSDGRTSLRSLNTYLFFGDDLLNEPLMVSFIKALGILLILHTANKAISIAYFVPVDILVRTLSCGLMGLLLIVNAVLKLGPMESRAAAFKYINLALIAIFALFFWQSICQSRIAVQSSGGIVALLMVQLGFNYLSYTTSSKEEWNASVPDQFKTIPINSTEIEEGESSFFFYLLLAGFFSVYLAQTPLLSCGIICSLLLVMNAIKHLGTSESAAFFSTCNKINVVANLTFLMLGLFEHYKKRAMMLQVLGAIVAMSMLALAVFHLAPPINEEVYQGVHAVSSTSSIESRIFFQKYISLGVAVPVSACFVSVMLVGMTIVSSPTSSLNCTVAHRIQIIACMLSIILVLNAVNHLGPSESESLSAACYKLNLMAAVTSLTVLTVVKVQEGTWILQGLGGVAAFQMVACGFWYLSSRDSEEESYTDQPDLISLTRHDDLASQVFSLVATVVTLGISCASVLLYFKLGSTGSPSASSLQGSGIVLSIGLVLNGIHRLSPSESEILTSVCHKMNLVASILLISISSTVLTQGRKWAVQVLGGIAAILMVMGGIWYLASADDVESSDWQQQSDGHLLISDNKSSAVISTLANAGSLALVLGSSGLAITAFSAGPEENKVLTCTTGLALGCVLVLNAMNRLGPSESALFSAACRSINLAAVGACFSAGIMKFKSLQLHAQVVFLLGSVIAIMMVGAGFLYLSSPTDMANVTAIFAVFVEVTVYLGIGSSSISLWPLIRSIQADDKSVAGAVVLPAGVIASLLVLNGIVYLGPVESVTLGSGLHRINIVVLGCFALVGCPQLSVLAIAVHVVYTGFAFLDLEEEALPYTVAYLYGGVLALLVVSSGFFESVSKQSGNVVAFYQRPLFLFIIFFV